MLLAGSLHVVYLSEVELLLSLLVRWFIGLLDISLTAIRSAQTQSLVGFAHIVLIHVVAVLFNSVIPIMIGSGSASVSSAAAAAAMLSSSQVSSG